MIDCLYLSQDKTITYMYKNIVQKILMDKF
ncbi:hypothetical protein NIES22_51780 [Calothrix brevissima NIES-22]|nr:hypothetical protein NIES22_51780 [Calothrix brevissima NIES-22]